MPIKCKLCDKEFKNKIQYRHLKGEHNMTVKEYELIYGKGSTDLSYVEAELSDEDKVECKECGEIVNARKGTIHTVILVQFIIHDIMICVNNQP